MGEVRVKLEDGKFYRRRDGKVVGPVKRTNDLVWPFWVPSENFITYRFDGLHCLSGWLESEFDLVAEYSNKPPELRDSRGEK